MSEIQTSSASGKKNAKGKLIKKNTRVDLTPMVDLGFLLITFFVFTTQLSQPTVMKVNMPFDKVTPGDEICESCVLTIMLKDNNTVQYHEGKPTANTIVHTTDLSAAGIRTIILQKKATVNKLSLKIHELVLIIKASEESTFQNFVDILDEVTINQIKYYYLADINAIDRAIFHLN